MYFIPFNCFKDKYCNCIYFSIKYDMEILNILFDYGYSSDDSIGYAHLLEHMIVKANQEEWSFYRNNGVQFNAVTDEDATVYTFLNLRNSNFLYKKRKEIGETFRNIQIQNIEQGLFVNEKATILEELSILERQFSTEIATRMLGNRDEIKNFTIGKMEDIYAAYYNSMIGIYIGNLKNKKKNFIPIYKNRKFNFSKSIVIKKKEYEYYLKECFETHIILFFLHICYISQLSREWDMEVHKDAVGRSVKFNGQIKIVQKSHILNRYCLLCTNLKMYMDEIKYIVMNDLLELNIEKAFFRDWEGVFND